MIWILAVVALMIGGCNPNGTPPEETHNIYEIRHFAGVDTVVADAAFTREWGHQVELWRYSGGAVAIYPSSASIRVIGTTSDLSRAE